MLNEDEQCIYVRANESGVFFLVSYVNDILLERNNVWMLQSLKTWLDKCFAMKDMGDVAYNHGINIYKDICKVLIGWAKIHT